jgi:hypothetical protein
MPLNRQKRTCDVCGVEFTTRIAKQLRCGRACARWIKNQRRIAKGRKTSAAARVSEELIARRIAAIRPAWSINPDLS